MNRYFSSHFTRAFVVILSVFGSMARASAGVQLLAPSLAPEVLSETVPTAFAPASFTSADYSLSWLGPAIPDVTISLGKESLEWVRVSEVLVVPRARLLVAAKGVEGGLVTNAGYSQPLILKGNSAFAEIPIALISGDKNPVELTVVQNGKQIHGTVIVRFRGLQKSKTALSNVYSDTSCSPFGLTAVVKNPVSDQWVYIGCRLVYVEGSHDRTSSLEVLVFWDNAGQLAEIGGIESPSPSTSVWPLRLRASDQPVMIKVKGQEVALKYFVPENLHKGFLGGGLGPYTYSYDAPGVNANTLVPFVTLYGSYSFSETARAVAFGAAPVHSAFYADYGLYFNTESARFLDRHLSLSLMLGAHVLSFRENDKMDFSLSAPQGVELIYRDMLKKGHNLSVGGFVYPPLNNRSYYNLWLRWGSGSFFGEFNYIGWQEPLTGGRAVSRSAGISFGMPLFRFF